MPPDLLVPMCRHNSGIRVRALLDITQRSVNRTNGIYLGRLAGATDSERKKNVDGIHQI